jgi:hypothetical protein
MPKVEMALVFNRQILFVTQKWQKLIQLIKVDMNFYSPHKKLP